MTRERRHAILLAALAWAWVLCPARAADDGDPYAQILGYRYDQSRKPLSAIEAAVRSAKPGELKDIEAKLLKALQSPTATPECKGWICGVLRQVGTEQSVAPVAALLADKEVSVRACIALQSLPGPKADEALREALGKLPTELKATVIQSIGARKDRKAAPLLAPLADDKDSGVAAAALLALGRISGAEALDALKKAKAAGELKIVQTQALLLCADGLAAEGKNGDAATVYGGIYKDGENIAVRIAALRGLAVADKAQGAAAITAALKGKDRKLQLTALQCLGDFPDSELVGRIVGDIGALEPELQAAVLTLVQDKAVLPAALKLLGSDNADVRLAAMKAAGRFGGASEIPALLAVAVKGGAEGKEALSALGALKDPKADDALLELLRGADASARAAALQLLKSRNTARALPEFLKATGDADEPVRLAAFEAVSALAGPDSYPAVVQAMLEARSDNERNAAEPAVLAVGRKVQNATERLAPLAAGLKGAAAPAKASVLRILGVFAGPEALQLVKDRLQDADATVSGAALRVLAAWPDLTAADELLKVLMQAQDVVPRTLALRGYLRLARLPEVTAEARTKMIEKAQPLARGDQEKNMLLLAQSKTPGTGTNIAPRGKASSLAGWKPDGQGRPAPAAIDNNPDTYWDEEDGKPLYRIAVTFDQPRLVGSISIMGYEHHNYAPKDFDVLADGKVIKEVRGAEYTDSLLRVELPPTQLKAIELKITGYYGASPAIREWGIYE